jgi:hypothetical protein
MTGSRLDFMVVDAFGGGRLLLVGLLVEIGRLEVGSAGRGR